MKKRREGICGYDGPKHPSLEIELEHCIHAGAKGVAQIDEFHAHGEKSSDGGEYQRKRLTGATSSSERRRGDEQARDGRCDNSEQERRSPGPVDVGQ